MGYSIFVPFETEETKNNGLQFMQKHFSPYETLFKTGEIGKGFGLNIVKDSGSNYKSKKISCDVFYQLWTIYRQNKGLSGKHMEVYGIKK